ncbi:trimeric intracellular cation channel type B, partial [Pelobates cultripes]
GDHAKLILLIFLIGFHDIAEGLDGREHRWVLYIKKIGKITGGLPQGMVRRVTSVLLHVKVYLEYVSEHVTSLAEAAPSAVCQVYLVYYFPSDLFYNFSCIRPIRVIVAALKEVTRTWKILSGVTQAHSRFQDAWLVMITIGWAKGAGGGLISNFEQLVRGVWKPESNELLKMSYSPYVVMPTNIQDEAQMKVPACMASAIFNVSYRKSLTMAVSALMVSTKLPISGAAALLCMDIPFKGIVFSTPELFYYKKTGE